MYLEKGEIVKTSILVVVYLLAIVLANLLASTYGPSITVLTAFLFIGLDFTTRDFLHSKWEHNHLRIRLFILIAAGSLLSYIVNINTAQIAFASLVAFAAAGIVDTIIYSVLHKNSWLVRINGSNVVSSTVDSFIFPTLAFGSF